MEILLDWALVAGVVLFLISFLDRFKKYRIIMIVGGLVLVTIGLIFLDTAALSDAFQRGQEAGRNP